MQIAKVMANYSLGEADLLRRAMGKKIKARMDAQRVRFVEGAVANGIKAADADRSSICSQNSRITASTNRTRQPMRWFRTRRLYEGELPDRVPGFVDEPRNLEHGQARRFRREGARIGYQGGAAGCEPLWRGFRGEGRRDLYAFAAVKGVGVEAARAILRARGDKPFASMADFARRIDPKALNKRTLEQLIGAGAFDALEPSRARLFAGLDLIPRRGNAHENAQATGQGARVRARGCGVEPAIAGSAADEPWSG